MRVLAASRSALLLSSITYPFPACSTAVSGLLERLASHTAASTSSSSSPAPAHQQQQPAALHAASYQGCIAQQHQQLQQQQHWQPNPSLQHVPSSSSFPHQHCCTPPSTTPSSSRSYAAAAAAGGSFGGLGRRRRFQQHSSSRMQHFQHHMQDTRDSSPDEHRAAAAAAAAATMGARGLLGRRLPLCTATEQLREPFDLENYSPWTDKRSEVMRPRQVDGTTQEFMEDTLLIRHQVEASPLPTALKRSMHITGPSWDELLLDVNRTIKVTKGGKVETIHAMVAVGNADGVIGIGEHSGKNVQKVIMDAELKAYKSLVPIPRYRQHTVYHAMDIKNRKVRMRIWPRVAGFGITASPLITQLCELVGLRDVTIKVTGRRKNIRNVVHTFMSALAGQSVPHDGVEGTGVYMREVWHGRELPCGLKRGVDL